MFRLMWSIVTFLFITFTLIYIILCTRSRNKLVTKVVQIKDGLSRVPYVFLEKSQGFFEFYTTFSLFLLIAFSYMIMLLYYFCFHLI